MIVACDLDAEPGVLMIVGLVNNELCISLFDFGVDAFTNEALGVLFSTVSKYIRHG